jgi:2-iminobutanoate/2-iminopropanoate deaminase
MGIVHGESSMSPGSSPSCPSDPQAKLDGFERQAEQVLDNVQAILEASGSSLARVLKATVYIADIAHWPRCNELYARRMGTHRPARTVVAVAALHYGYLVEMDVIAALAERA